MAIYPNLKALGTVVSTLSKSSGNVATAMNGLASSFSLLNEKQILYIARTVEMSKADLFATLQKAGFTREQRKSIAAQIEATGAIGATTKATNAQTTATVAATGATGGLTNAMKGLGVVMKAHPIMTALTVLSIVIPIVTALVDHFTTSAEELQAELNDVESDLSNINSELETTQSRIKDLESMDTLSVTEQEELDRLKIQNEYLETQLYLLKERERELAKQTNKNVEMELGKSLAKGAGPSDVEVVGADDGGNEIITYAQRTTEDYYPIAIARLKELYAAKAEYADMSDDERNAFDQEIASLEAFIKSTATLYSTSAAQLNLADESAKQLYDDWMQLATAGSDILQWYSPLGDINDSIASVTDAVRDLSTAIKAMSSYEDAYDKLSNALGEFIEDGAVSADTVSNLMEIFGETDTLTNFISVLGQEGVTAAQVEEALSALGNEYISNSEILDQLTEDNAGWVVSVLEANGVLNAKEVVTNRLMAQQVELQYATGLAANATWDESAAYLRAAGAAEEAITAFGNLRQAQYSVTAASTDFVSASTSVVEGLLAQAKAAGVASDKQAALANIIRLKTLMKEGHISPTGGEAWAREMEKYQQQAQLAISDLNFDFKVDVSSNRNTSSSSSSSSDPWKDEFEAYYNAHKHAVAMEQETLADFYAWLDGQDGYKKYFANNEKYLDEFYKYSEEVFEGLRDLADDAITDGEHQIFVWEYQGGHEADIVKKYRELQAQVHTTAESIREAMRDAGWSELEIENSEIIQELQKQWVSFSDSIKDIFESISDTVDDYINDVEHQIYLLEKEAGDTGENDAAILAKYASLEAYILKQIDAITDTMKSLGYTETQIANSGAIQELQKRLWDIRDSVKDIVDTLNDDLYDSMQALLDITIEMIRQEKEDEKDALETLIDDYSTIIAQRREMLQLAERERSYHETVAEKTSEIAKIQARIDALSLDDSRAAAIERASLEEDLADLAKELADTQREHAIDATEDQLDKELADFEDTQDKKIQAIEDFLNDQQSLNQAALNRLDSANQSLFNDLLSYALHYTSTTRAELEDMWNSALSAAQNYGSYVNAMNAAQTGSYYTGSNVGSGTSSSLPSVRALVEDLVSKMMANSAAWYTGDKAALANKNAEYAAQIAGLIGEDVVRGNDGVWYIGHVGGPKLYEDYAKYCYHTGGVVGNVPTLKQNEVLSLLEKGELVLNTAQQGNMVAMLDQLKPLNALKEALSTVRSGAMIPAVAGGPTLQIDASVNIDGSLPEKQIIQAIVNQQRKIANIVYECIKK